MEINTLVTYGVNGICRIVEICERTIDGADRRFYVLRPLDSETSTIYVPADSEVLCKKMKQLLTPDEVLALIGQMPETDTIWIENDRERNECYHKILAGGDCRELTALAKTLYQRKQYLARFGRKLRSADERTLQLAEKSLFGELAVVWGIERGEVPAFIEERLNFRAKTEELNQ